MCVGGCGWGGGGGGVGVCGWVGVCVWVGGWMCVFSNIFSETTGPAEAKFNMGTAKLKAPLFPGPVEAGTTND